jgi:hypothetical protein
MPGSAKRCWTGSLTALTSSKPVPTATASVELSTKAGPNPRADRGLAGLRASATLQPEAQRISSHLVQRTATGGPKLIATAGPRSVAKRSTRHKQFLDLKSPIWNELTKIFYSLDRGLAISALAWKIASKTLEILRNKRVENGSNVATATDCKQGIPWRDDGACFRLRGGNTRFRPDPGGGESCEGPMHCPKGLKMARNGYLEQPELASSRVKAEFSSLGKLSGCCRQRTLWTIRWEDRRSQVFLGRFGRAVKSTTGMVPSLHRTRNGNWIPQNRRILLMKMSRLLTRLFTPYVG